MTDQVKLMHDHNPAAVHEAIGLEADVCGYCEDDEAALEDILSGEEAP